MFDRIKEKVAEPKFIRSVNGWFTVAWAIWFIPAIAITGLRNSILLVAIYSIWANMISHYTAWMAARVEVRAEHVENMEVEAS